MIQRRIGLAVAAAAAAAMAGAAPAAAQDATEPDTAADVPAAEPGSADWTLQLEAGSEYDSNVHRLDRSDGDEGAAIDGSPLARLGARHRLTWRRNARERLTLSSHAGLKVFTADSAQSENVAVLAAEGGYEWSLVGRGAVIGLSGSYYDAIPYHQSDTEADSLEGRYFRIGTGESSLTLIGKGGHRVTAVAGYRAFDYKPDADFGWHGEHIGLNYQATLWRGDPDRDDDAASVDLGAGYRVERRVYGGSALTSACDSGDSVVDQCVAPTGLGRADLNHSLVAEAVYTGRRIYSARYELQVNDSNSLGESLIRQRLRLGFTTELGRELYLTAEATVLLHIYLDPLLVAGDQQALTFISIDEENRNSLSMHLARALGRRWALEGRYAIYSNEFTNQELTFRRQTVYLGAVYRYER